MNGNGRVPELLAPAGSPEGLEAAVVCGADAVYLGGSRFSARANAVNFSDGELKAAVEYCHLRGVKVQRAMNIEIFNGELKALAEAAAFSAECGVDALIVSDLGAARIIKKTVPDMPLHASTQMTVHTVKGAEEAAALGFSRVVLARELPLKVIKEICGLGITETEIFVHGALCMSVSGQCLMSAFIGSRSANRGRCAQACRLPFSAGRCNEETHGLSLKDLSYINRIKELSDIGIDSFKIEGRMKRPEYAAAAVTAFRAALSGKTPDEETLRAVFSRSGFTDGWLDGGNGAGMFGFRSKEDAAAAADVLPALRELYRTEKPRYPLDMRLTAKIGEPSRLKASCGEASAEAEGDVPQTAVNRPLTAEYASKQLSKLGGTVFYAGSLECETDGKAALSAAALNSLRREAVSECERLVLRRNTPVYGIFPCGEGENKPRQNRGGAKKRRIVIPDGRLLDIACGNADSVIMPADKCGEFVGRSDKLIPSPPPFTLDEKRDTVLLGKLRDMGFKKLFCHNIAHIRMGRELGFEMYGSPRLNCANIGAVRELADMGLSGITVSYETPSADIPALTGIMEISVTVYGYVPVMLTRNCPVMREKGCVGCTGRVTDRTGRSFAVKCAGSKEYTEIFNCDRLYMADRLEELRGADCFDYIFGGETPAEIKRCLDGEKPSGDFTRGLYRRKIL